MVSLWQKHLNTEWSFISKMVPWYLGICALESTNLYYQLLVHSLDLTNLFCFLLGHFCQALPKAIKTMRRGEKVNLIVQPQCTSFQLILCYHSFGW